jgi:hypothetical protein
MRTPAVHVGSQLLDFLKNGAQFRLFENREDHMPLSLYTTTPSGKDFIKLFSRKSLGSAPMLRPIRSVKNIETSRPRPKASHLGKTHGNKQWFCH